MNLSELSQRMEKWEDLHTEFKEEAAHEDDLSAALVAFANTDGGQLVMGVSKTKQIVGIRDADKVMQRLDQISVNNCEPPLTIIQETVATENGIVIVVNIPKGDQRPYRTNRGDYFIRATSGRRRASRQELLRLFQSVESLYYDETLALRASLQDLDTKGFTYFFEQAYRRPAPVDKELENTLKNMRLLGEQSGEIHPTLAGLLCFGREPQRFVYHAQIIAARIPGVSLSAEPSDLKQIEGTLLEMFEDAARFVNLHLPIPHVIKGLEPETRPELPETALRELLVNAIVHRDLTIHAPIRVLIFDNRIEIHTPGVLPNGVTVESILLGAAHVLRNPTIYSIFNRAGLVTHLGSGVLRAKELIEQTSGTTIQLAIVEHEFITTIFRPSKKEIP